jgi:pSer/pThr/pTyr-binding forkhead associated (FHA) protein
MKVSLVVSQGIHKGKAILVPTAQFVIGRDEDCQLRPSSPAVSKRHCAILIKNGQVFLKDFGSTNGTFVNDTPVTGEVEVKHDDQIRVGPLEFVLRLKSSDSSLTAKSPSKAGLSKLTPPPKDDPTKEQKTASAEDTDAENMAALLLSTDDGPPGPLTDAGIPGGSTVFEMPVPNPDDPNAPPAAKKPPTTEQDNSKRAGDILRKYMQRPRQQ